MDSPPNRPYFATYETGYSGASTNYSDTESPPTKLHFTTYGNGYSGVPTTESDAHTVPEKPLFVYNDTRVSGESTISSVLTPPADSPFFKSGASLARKRSPWKTLLIQAFALLWLAPAIFLLVVNLKGWNIGASAWCPGGHCFVDMFNPLTAVPEANELRFDHIDHNVLGALQVPAKLLEIWFEMIAASFVYLLTMRLANMKEGLPVGYLARPVEFSDPFTLFDIALWKNLPALWGRRRHHIRIWLWLFVIGTVVLCGLCNLMGPATAVLLIPTLGWHDLKPYGSDFFEGLNSANPPLVGNWGYLDMNGLIWAWNDTLVLCDSNNFAPENQTYSCTQSMWGQQLDNWNSAYMSSNEESGTTYTAGQSVLQQGIISFMGMNMTYTGDQSLNPYSIYWVPSRQAIDKFTYDSARYQNVAHGFRNVSDLPQDEYESYFSANNSLRLQIQRNGPVTGTFPSFQYQNGNFTDPDDIGFNWTTTVDSNRDIKCYSFYAVEALNIVPGDSGNNFTKCIQVGTGWGENTKSNNFSIQGLYNEETESLDPGINIKIYASDRVAYLPNGELPSGISDACLEQNGTAPSTCDWDLFFAIDNTSSTANISRYVNTMELSKSESDGLWISALIDYVAFYNFTQYVFDPSPLTNPLRLVTTQALPETGTPFAIDPAWTLAAWAVDGNGVMSNERSTAILLNNVLKNLMYYQTLTGPDQVYLPYNLTDAETAIIFLPVFSTLSFLDWNSTKTTTYAEDDLYHPVLQRTGMQYIWAYGMQSRTSYLGAVVMCCGIAVVLAHFVMGIVDKRKYKSLTQLIVAALEHEPQKEFHDKEHNELQMSRVRFHVRDADHKAGKYEFKPVKSTDSEMSDRIGMEPMTRQVK